MASKRKPIPELYKILGIKPNATQEAVTAAFRKNSMEHHPDRGGDQEEFAKVTEAYRVLSNPDLRASYDRTGVTPGKNEDSIYRSELLGKVTIILENVTVPIVNSSTYSLTSLTDIIDKMKRQTNDGITIMKDRLQTMKQAIRKRQELAKRIKHKQGNENILAGLLLTPIRNLEEQLKQQEHELRIGQDILKFLEDYEDTINGSLFTPMGEMTKIPNFKVSLSNEW